MGAIGHEPTDLVPIDLGAMRATDIMAIAYSKLKDYLALDSFLHPFCLRAFLCAFAPSREASSLLSSLAKTLRRQASSPFDFL